jgi:hypothetical protein
LTKKAPYKGLGADSEEKHEPVSDIDTAVVDSLKALDPKRPIREADIGINPDRVYCLSVVRRLSCRRHLRMSAGEFQTDTRQKRNKWGLL